MGEAGKVEALLGLQWGDEGKGKWVDAMAPNYDIVARFQGGANAGHTLIVNGQKIVLHQIPSAVLHKNVKLFIGDGVVLDLVALHEEVKSIIDHIGENALKGRLWISEGAHIISPLHVFLDKKMEKSARPIGSTLKGIGPAYEDVAGRRSTRLYELGLNGEKSRIKMKNSLEWHVKHRKFTAAEKNDLNALHDDYDNSIKKVDPFLNKHIRWIKGMPVIQEAVKGGSKVLAEGAQGTLLDLTHGTYPYVTSSHTTAGSICTGLGVAPNQIGKVYGVCKAYCTRVGEGPFPTELNGKEAETLQRLGHEFGATTGRQRRCGWLDLHALNYAVQLNGVEELFLSKVDILAKLDTVKVCVGYKDKRTGKPFGLSMPYRMETIEPIYEELPSWPDDLSQYKSKATLSPELKAYIALIEAHVKVRVGRISYGVERDAILIL